MKDHAIFFDLDDTLYDRSKPFTDAFRLFFPQEYSADGRDRAAYWACEKRGNEVFLPSQRGEITMDEMYIYRYRKGFADVSVSISPEQALEFQKVYRCCQQKICLAEGVPELLDFCKDAFKHVGIITNGPAEKQLGKLKTLQVENWIPAELTLISGIIKIDKPDPAIFHLAEERADTAAENMIFVGDSLANDIRPAFELGWKTIYLHKKPTEMKLEGIKPNLVLGGEEVLTEQHLKKVFSIL